MMKHSEEFKQEAGALYGAGRIPKGLMDKLAHWEWIRDAARMLFAAA